MKNSTKFSALALFASLSLSMLNAQNACFLPQVTYASGAAPVGNCTGDFNGDGKLDIASANQTGTVSIFLGIGNGTFGAATNFAAGSQPYGIATADFNGDNKLDLAVANIMSANLSILIGNGTGSFAAPVNYGTAANAREVAVGYFDNDNIIDLAVVAPISNNVAIFLGIGNGTFNPLSGYSIGGAFIPEDLVIDDFNSDGKLDVATANSTGNNCSVLFGDGFGSFNTGIPYPTGTGSYGISSGDFNSDGKSDLCVSNNGNSNVSVLLNNGNGTFGLATQFGLGVGSAPRNVKVADFNNDGKRDMAISDPGLNKAIVLLGDGAGGFPVQNNFTVSNAVNYLSLGDFNADGKIDMVVSNQASANNGVLLNNAPTVTLNVFSTVCSNWPAFALTGGSPANGTYSGIGVNGGMFDPSITGNGTFTINYSYNDMNGCNANAQQTITVDPCVGIQLLVNESHINIFPNPSAGKFKLSGDRPFSSGEIIVRDLGGQIIFRSVNLNQEFDLGKQAAGMYLVEVRNGDKVMYKKLIID